MTLTRRRNSQHVLGLLSSAKRSGEAFNVYHFMRSYPAILSAAKRAFGSWRKAVEAAGLDYDKVRKYRQWSKGKVLAEIKHLVNAKTSLRSKDVQTKFKALYMAAAKQFGSWGAAVNAAGVDYGKISRRRRMSNAEIKEAILKLHRKGVSLCYQDMRKRHPSILAAATKKLGGGSWVKARRKCGICINYRCNTKLKNEPR